MAKDFFQNRLQRLAAAITAFYIRFLKIRGTPGQISLGMALGLFIGMTPFMGFHTIAAVAMASLFGWSKLSAGIGVFVTNPLSAPFIYSVTYQLGSRVSGYTDPGRLTALFEDDGVMALIKSSPKIILDLLIGGVIIGVPLAVIGYYITFKIVTDARKKWKQRKPKKARQKTEP